MKKSSLRTFTIVLALLLAGTLCVSAPAQAFQWVDVHGSSGHVEYSANTTGVKYKAWGLDFTEKPNLNNWIHYSIPGTAGKQVQYIYLQYYKSNAAVGKFWSFDIYDGSVKVRSVNAASNIATGWGAMVVNLGTPITFANAMGISIYVTNGAGNTTFRIGDVGGRIE